MQFRDFTNYDIDKQGRILNIKTNKELKPTLDGSGYPQTKLYKDGISSSFHIHKIVYVSFNGEVPQGYEIDHINGDKTDYRLENLRCVTHKENVNNHITLKRFLKAIKTDEYIKKHRESCAKRRGQKLSDEIRKKMSEAHNGKCPPKHVLEAAKKAHQKRVYQYTLDGEFVREYYPLNTVEEYGFDYRSVIRCCVGKRKTYKGYKWSYEPL